MKEKTTLLHTGKPLKYWVINPEMQKTALVIHGFRGNHKALVEMSSAMKHRVILVDLPGHGESYDIDSQYTIEDMAKFIQDFTESLNLSKFSLIGHSYGSLIAMKMASNPKVEKLVLINTPLNPNNLSTKFSQIYFNFSGFLPDSWQKAYLYSRIIDRFSGKMLIKNVSKERRKQLVKQGFETLPTVKPEAILYLFKSYRSFNTLKVSKTLTQPTLLIAGYLDPMCPHNRLNNLANNIRNSSLKIVKKHGHLVPLEKPRYTAQLINSFLSES